MRFKLGDTVVCHTPLSGSSIQLGVKYQVTKVWESDNINYVRLREVPGLNAFNEKRFELYLPTLENK